MKIMNIQFIMYVFLYLTPVCTTLFTKDEKIHNLCL